MYTAAPSGETPPRKVRTRGALLTAARELYDRDGIQETSVEAIAALAGVSVGSVYSHFGSKEGLALEIVSQAVTDLEHQLQVARNRPDALRRVRAAGEVYLQFAVAHPALARFMATQAMTSPTTSLKPGGRACSIDRRVRSALLDTAGDLREAMDDGHIRRMPVDALLVSLWGLCAGVSDMVSRRDGLAIPPELAKRALLLATTLILEEHPPQP